MRLRLRPGELRRVIDCRRQTVRPIVDVFRHRRSRATIPTDDDNGNIHHRGSRVHRASRTCGTAVTSAALRLRNASTPCLMDGISNQIAGYYEQRKNRAEYPCRSGCEKDHGEAPPILCRFKTSISVIADFRIQEDQDQVMRRSSWSCMRCGCVGTTRTLNP